ncbi:MAG: YebC/PmpR family DNA-binding transcriptional regulator [Pyrinomonadaceae bacterium]|nr:YebC/PmpR family DNA-binding transcriptional regulator [Pyrinomonadaceae bacterium]MCX7640303.1 YebC/PmpR family DNA-binding transcriptional regulator [Pyrinomonadaceae bacterium]MDW8303377.1 YebC/PmpR family DNA-binding transcriptional regulator [Acidobacteriota bacterium]
MSGHSKWHTIKHKKSLLDARRGKIFTKLIREITVAARVGGSGDPSMNPRLRKAIADAKAQNMPNETIERAIKRGTGELEGESYEEITYEGYGIGGVALLIETMTDNRNRTVAELRHLLTKHGGSLGEAGSVAWMFEKKGLIVVEKSQKSEEELLELAIEAGADDMKTEEDVYEIYTSPENFEAVEEAIRKAGIKPQMAEVSMIPKTYIKLEGEDAKRMIKLYEAIEDHDDVQKVYANFEIDESRLD